MRLALLCDYREEGWTSMDLLGDALFEALRREPSIEPVRIKPSQLPWLGGPAQRFPLVARVKRFAARLVEYPIQLATEPRQFHGYHIVDHSYSHLAHVLPNERLGIYCHDIDAFRASLEPRRHLRADPRAPAAIALSSILRAGFRRARVVFYSTRAVREELEQHRLIPPDRLVHAPYGIAPEFVPSGEVLLPSICPGPYLLNVSSCAPRKNIDFLLRLFRRLLQRRPGLFLVQVGGHWTAAQERFLKEARLEPRVVQLRGVSTARLAALYRGAACVVMPTLREGFGLPLVEALACNAPVAASDLPVLREVGGDAALYLPVSDLERWAQAVSELVEGVGAPPVAKRQVRAALYSWRQHGRTIAEAYHSLE